MKLTLTLLFTFLFVNMLFTTPVSSAKEETWKSVNSRATGLYKEQKFIKAHGAALYALELARKLPDSEKDKVAISLGNLSMISTHLGNFGEAETSAKEELTIREELSGKDNVEVLKAWNHLAIVYTMSQSPMDAEQCLKQMITITEKTYGKESPESLATLYKLDKFYKITKNDKKEKALAARLKKLDPPQ